MRNLRNILVFCLLSLSAAVFCPAQAQDFSRLSERTIMGTARYVGMAGAMSAVGGDPSAVMDNVAGLGLYRRSEVMITFDETLDRTQTQGTSHTSYQALFSVPQASAVISFPTYNPSDKGVQFHNILLAYNRKRTYSRDIYAITQSQTPSLGRLLTSADVNWDIPFCADPYAASSSLQLYERGQVNDFSFNWAMNISNQWYVGAGAHIHSVNFSSEATYTEVFERTNEERNYMSNRNYATLLMSGAGFSGSVGLIYRPIMWLRLGFGLETASVGSLRTYCTGRLTALTDSLRDSYGPDMNYSNADFHMPWHISTSATAQIGAYGMIALQYDYFHQKGETDIHSLRAGIEVIPILGFYINAGYAYESTFKNDRSIVPFDNTFCRQDTHFQHPLGAHYASLALGYRGTHVMAQAAYQYRFQNLHLWPHENADPFLVNTQTHRIVITLAWHRYY